VRDRVISTLYEETFLGWYVAEAVSALQAQNLWAAN